MSNYPLTHFLDAILGPGEPGSGANRKYSCPFPGCATRPSKLAGEKKLEINQATDELNQNLWSCWSCRERGKTILSLLKNLKSPKHRFDELKAIIKYTDKQQGSSNKKVVFDGILPAEYKFLGDITKTDIAGRHAMVYLKNRGYTETDVFKYSIGYCEDGDYSNRVIIPSYDAEGNINYFISRSIDEECPHKWRYKNPPASRDIVPFEMYINWDEPLIICEGGFDMMAIKRNVAPLMDKILTDSLLKKILSSSNRKIYMAIDKDALRLALTHCETLMNYGKKLYLVDMTDKDPSAMGFEKFTRLIQTTQPLTQSKLMKLKIQLV